MNGQIYLIPTTLGEGNLETVIPQYVQQIACSLRYFVVENVRTARRYLRKIDKKFPIDGCIFFELNKHTQSSDLQAMIEVAKSGSSLGIISEAGCPAVADPGSDLVALAHENNVRVVPLVGPSSILLALMASGFSGQQFIFHGYLPKEQNRRMGKIKEIESSVRQTGQTHIFMETPFRNNHLQEDLFNSLSDATLLCIATNLTTSEEFVVTKSIEAWKKSHKDLSKKPSLFLIGKSGNVMKSAVKKTRK